MTQALVEASQLNGAQTIVGPATQLPAPSHTRPPPTEAPVQVPGWQTVPVTKVRQLPLPSQVPSSPQVEIALFGQILGERGRLPAALSGRWGAGCVQRQVPPPRPQV